MIIIRKWMIYVALMSFMIVTAPDRHAHEQRLEIFFEDTEIEAESMNVSLTPVPQVTFHNIYLFTYTLHNRRVLTFGAVGFVFYAGG